MANEPQQHIEDVNSFGTDLPKRIKAKLTARQLLAAHALEPNQSIQFPFPVRDGDDEGASTMTVQEALGGSDQNFGGDADLSSRTPVARMWTAVRLMERTDFTMAVDVHNSKDKDTTTETFWEPISNIKVYQLGNHILSTTSPAAQDASVPQGSIDTRGLFPDPQHSQTNPNEFLAPPSGITSVTIRMPDPGDQASVAINKFTTVTFLVNNIHDFNNIYSRYFLTHRAQLIVDVAWDTAALYNPHDIMDTDKLSGLGRGDSLYKVLFGRDNGEGQKDGYVTEANGDMDTIIGQVMDYSATYRPDGSVECTVQIHSANYDLMKHSFIASDDSSMGIGKKLSSRVDEIVRTKINTSAGMTEGKDYKLDPTTHPTNLPLGSLPNPKNTPPALKAGILENGAFRIWGDPAVSVGNPTDFLSIGVIEDELLSVFGSDAPNGARGGRNFNSNGSFTNFVKELYESQASETDYNNLKLLYPQDWGILPTAKKYKAQDQPKSGDEAHTPWTKEQHMESRDRLQPGITRFHIYSDGAAQSQNDIPSDPRIVRTNGSYAVTTDTRPEMNATQPVANGGNIIGTAPTDAEYTILTLHSFNDGLWYKIAFPWTGDSLAKAEETYLSRTVPKEVPDPILLPRLSWDSMNAPIYYPIITNEDSSLYGTSGGGDTKSAQVDGNWFWPDTVTIPGTFDAFLPGENINENSYTAPQWADGTVFKQKQVGYFVEQQPNEWNDTKTIYETMIDLPRLKDYSAGAGTGPDYRLYIDDAPGLGGSDLHPTGNILIADSDIPGNPEIYWWRFETSECEPGAYWGQNQSGGLPHRYQGWFYPRIFYRQIKSGVGSTSTEHVGEWKWSLDPRAPFPGGWVPMTERVMKSHPIHTIDESGIEMTYDPKEQKVDGVPLTNWLDKEIVSNSTPYYDEWVRTRMKETGGLGPPISMGSYIDEKSDQIDQKIMEIFGVAKLGYLRNESTIMVDRENVAIMNALEQRTRIAKFESEEKTQTDRLLRSLSVPQPGPHQGWIHWTAGQPIDLPEEEIIMEESKDRVSYAWKRYTKEIKNDAIIERNSTNPPWDGNEVKQRFRDALRGKSNSEDQKVEGDEVIQQLVPIRELFVNTQVLKNAFANATDLADALRRLLQDLNNAGSGAYNFRTASNNQLATGVAIIDAQSTPIGPKNLNDLFVFSPYSQNSIIKNLNFQFQTPSNEVMEAQLGVAMIERGMNDGIMPVNEVLDKYLTTNLLEQADLLEHTDIQWWTPKNASSEENFDPKSEFLRTDLAEKTPQDKKDMSMLFGTAAITGHERSGVPDVMKTSVSTPDGETVSYATAKAAPIFAPVGSDTTVTVGDSPYMSQNIQDGIVLKNTKSVKDMVTKVDAFLSRSTPTPYNVTFDMYGIASNFGGRLFRMDFIPDRWFNKTYFRAYEQTQTITPETWTTSISAQMLTVPKKLFLHPPGKAKAGKGPALPYPDKNIFTVDPNSEEFEILTNWAEISNRVKGLRIISHRGEHFSTGPLLGGTLRTDLKNCTAPVLPTLTAKWCSKYIGPNAPQWINDWVYGFYGAYYSPDGNLNLPENPLNHPKDDWRSGTPEVLMEQRYGRGIPCTSDGRLEHVPSPGRVTGAPGSGDNSYGAGPVSTVRALFDLRANVIDLKGQRGINIPRFNKIRIVRYHKYWLVYPAEFPIPGKEPQTFQLDASKLFSIFMEMTQPNKYK